MKYVELPSNYSSLARLSPARDWQVNKNLNNSLAMLEEIKQEYGSSLSMADLIVLAGTTALNKAAGTKVDVPFCSVGRVDDDKGQAWRFLEPRVRYDGSRDLFD